MSSRPWFPQYLIAAWDVLVSRSYHRMVRVILLGKKKGNFESSGLGNMSGRKEDDFFGKGELVKPE